MAPDESTDARLSRIAAACEEEQARIVALRLFVWTDAFQGDRICPGLTLMPLTFGKWLALIAAKNALFTGSRAPARKDYLDYLWRASSGYALRGPRGWWQARRFNRCPIHAADDDYLERICSAHIEQNFFDSPTRGGSPSSHLQPVEPIVSNLIALATTMTITPQAALRWTLPQGFAVLREHYRTTDKDYVAPEPPGLNRLQLDANRVRQQLFDQVKEAFNHAD